MEKHRGARAGFTLIELLVVIAIIAVLAALLLGALAGARGAADIVVCEGNLHQISIGCRLYVDDFHGYPLDGAQWFLQPYVHAALPRGTGANSRNQHSVWICPSYARHGGVSDWDEDSGRIPTIGYGYNQLGYITPEGSQDPPGQHGLGNGGGDWRGERIRPLNGPPIRDQDLVCPSDMIEFGDAVVGGVNGAWGQTNLNLFDGWPDLSSGVYHDWVNYNILAGLVPPPFSMPSHTFQLQAPFIAFYRQRHGGRWNLVFCDGHVESLRPQNVFDTRKPQQMARWNRDHLPHLHQPR